MMVRGVWGKRAIAERESRERVWVLVCRKSIGSASIRTRYPPSAPVQSTEVKEPTCVTGDLDAPAG
jgi:hypothetical protein